MLTVPIIHEKFQKHHGDAWQSTIQLGWKTPLGTSKLLPFWQYGTFRETEWKKTRHHQSEAEKRKKNSGRMQILNWTSDGPLPWTFSDLNRSNSRNNRQFSNLGANLITKHQERSQCCNGIPPRVGRRQQSLCLYCSWHKRHCITYMLCFHLLPLF